MERGVAVREPIRTAAQRLLKIFSRKPAGFIGTNHAAFTPALGVNPDKIT